MEKEFIERRMIVSDPQTYLAEKLKEVPNMARVEMAVHRRAFLFGRDHVKILNQKSAETSGKENV